MKAILPNGFAGGMNLQQLAQQAQQAQEQMQKASAELEAKEYTASAGGSAVEVTVNDEDGATVDNMQVQFLSLDDASALPIVISTDANGVASTVLKCGNYEISAMNSDAISAEKVITVKPYTLRSIDPTAQKESITVRTRLGYLVGAVNVKQLSYGEIIAAGIDVNAPGNKNIFEFEVKYKYRVNEYDYEDEIIKYFYNGYGSFIGYHTF